MFASTTSLLLLLATLTSAQLTPLPSLQPWLITSLSTASPNPRPGSSAWDQITLRLQDPNIFDAGTTQYGNSPILPGPFEANCTARWNKYDFSADRQPWNTPMQCSEPGGSGHWTWWMRRPEGQNGSATTQFDLEFRLEIKVRVAETLEGRRPGEWKLVERTTVGRVGMRVGENMAGQCGGSGVCFWGLKGSTPVPIQPQVTLLKNGTDIIVG